MYSYIDAKIIAPLMQHVKLYTDNLLFWYRDLVHLDSINIPKFDGTNVFFSNSTGTWPNVQEGGKIPTLRLQHAVSAVWKS